MKDSGLQVFCIQSIRIICFGIIAVLTILSILFTSVEEIVTYTTEDGYELSKHLVKYYDDRTRYVLLFLLLLIIICYLGNSKLNISDKGKKYFLIVLGIIYVSTSFAYIIVTKQYQLSDAEEIQATMLELLEGNFTSYAEGGYLFKYPYQVGYLIYELFFYKILKDNAFIVMQLINVLELTLTFYVLGKIISILWKEVKPFIYCLFSLICSVFIPMSITTSVLYGNIPSLMFSVLACYFIIRFIDNNRWLYAVVAAFSISIAIQSKPNAKVFLIAIIIYVLVSSINKSKVILWAVPIFILVNFIIGLSVKGFMFNWTGMELPEGLPPTGCIVMGINEGPIAPGCFNGRDPELAEENGYDYEKTKEAGLNEIRDRIDYLVHNPKYAVGFYGRKISAQWNDPLYQSFFILEWFVSEDDTLANYWLRGSGRTFINEFLNILQSFILVGCLFYLGNYKKKYKLSEMLLLLVFLGGFVFHLFWESKSAYALFFWIILFPYTCIGYGMVFDALDKRLNS